MESRLYRLELFYCYLQNRGTTPDKLSRALRLLLDHAAGNHSGCPTGENSWCRWNRPPSSTTPATLTTFTTIDIQKVREAFNSYATTNFCSHLTLGLTQNANESLHNMIWSKNKYVSPQSIRTSTAIAVLICNEGELSLFGIMYDLGLAPLVRSTSLFPTGYISWNLPEPPRRSLISNDEEEE